MRRRRAAVVHQRAKPRIDGYWRRTDLITAIVRNRRIGISAKYRIPKCNRSCNVARLRKRGALGVAGDNRVFNGKQPGGRNPNSACKSSASFVAARNVLRDGGILNRAWRIAQQRKPAVYQ